MSGRRIEELYEELFVEKEISYDVFTSKIHDCLRRLRTPHVAMLTGVYIVGQTFNQVAETYSVSAASVINSIKNSKKELKLLLLDGDEITLDSPVIRLTNKCSQTISCLSLRDFIYKLNDGKLDISEGTDLVIEKLEKNFNFIFSDLVKYDKKYPANLFHEIYKEVGYKPTSEETVKQFDILKYILESDAKKLIINPTDYLLIQKRFKDKASVKDCAEMFHKSHSWVRENCKRIEKILEKDIKRRMEHDNYS